MDWIQAVILHAGSLFAVVGYFRRELVAMARDWLASLTGRAAGADSTLAQWIMIGTIPAGVFGLLFKQQAETVLRSPVIVAVALIGFGMLLGWADLRRRGQRDEYSLGSGDVLIIGSAQVLALIPGTSRSSITITAGLFLGMTREEAARFSFLLAIPVIAAAGLLSTLDLARSEIESGAGVLLLGLAVSTLSTYACIHYFLAFIRKIGMQPFVAYRVILGGLLLAFWL